jgi:hypothetical protein
VAGKELQFKAALMQWGPIPPSGGPHRLRYLDINGRAALQTADDEFARALGILRTKANSMPVIHDPLVEDDDDVRRGIQRKKRSDWIEFVTTIDQAMLDEIEAHIRRSESSAVAALNFLEDHELAETAHEVIHRASFVRRGLYGCPIVRRDDELWTDCSINLSHLRVGISVGIVSDFECSICGHLVEDCDHAMGATYNKVAARDKAGKCIICDSADCEHVVGLAYPTVAYANARNMIPQEVSMVPRPRYPQARIVENTVDLDGLSDDPRILRAAEHGVLNCDACLGPCKGFNEMSSWNTRQVSGTDLRVESS